MKMERDPQLTLQGERLLEHHAWLRELAEDLVRDPSEADDAVQETFLAALTYRGTARRPAPWLRAVLRNCIRQGHRSRARRRRREATAARPECAVGSPDGDLEEEELRARLGRHVARLGEPYRSVVVLHYLNGLSLEEIARRQDTPAATVRTRLRRALGELRRRLTSRERVGVAGLILGPLRPGDAASVGSTAVSAAARPVAAHVSSSLCVGGVMHLGVKSVTIASAVSLGLLGTVGGLYLLGAGSSAEKPTPALTVDRPAQPAYASPALAGDAASREASPEANRTKSAALLPAKSAARRGAAGGPESESAESGADTRGIGEPASEAVLALRRDYGELRRLFNDSSQGWKLVGDHIAGLREAITQSEAGFEEFLALIDGEEDGPFLEAILHHLPLRAGSPFQREIVEDEELHEELWARFEDETDPYRQRSFLRFFCYHPQLSSKRMREFSEIAQHGESPLVRGISLDAISSADFPKETWPALCEVAEHDADESLRALAIRGLAGADSERAGEIYRAAFSSDSEAIRAAAIGARRGESPPPEAVGGDYPSYLVRELRSASTKEYRQALLDRLLAVDPLTLLHEADRALRAHTDRQARRQYRSANDAARERIEQRR